MNYRGGEAGAFLRRYGILAKPAFQLANVVTAPSKFLAEVLGLHTGVAVTIVPNIIDLTTFPYRKRNTLRPKMLVTRHLEKLYDIDSIIRAFEAVTRTYPEALLWIAGTGSQEAHLRNLVARLNLQNVTFLGYVPQKKLSVFYEECDLLLNASRADNFPGALLEGSAAGLLVISTRAGGIPAIYEDGETAILVEPGDWRELAEAIETALRSPSRGLNIAAQAAQMVQAFDWQNVRELLYRAYGFALNDRAAQTPPYLINPSRSDWGKT